ncbi:MULTISPECIES: hypothetical protein [Aneurinibacillus]|uniref:IDEAL domain-containing protein n=1 Tax=Aneurinibacillus thermoaerophilus TaxID=143495 RepID=A0A1G7X4T1_ANETH|nr:MULTISPECIES: hypothetical protein [Aneurinibacillus]AMA73202.1 hypothetical protein ACH33_10250 [Aneurinibacillus sp. XH2]MED0674374.1 hypothetical protein [Aneurinibacillus thermoaerophilus]MED0678394.1 hypothetical protein [Aneurinibacillus thermoaerophilus]MED0736082.1 hypothetical protein [Aneurinibacillus thermoaerophilus]MED0756929.1 hypothetical protein [Aneurinibacillus thermoaerophilus]
MEHFSVGEWVRFPYNDKGRILLLTGYVKEMNKVQMMMTVFVPTVKDGFSTAARSGHFRVPLDVAEKIKDLQLEREDYDTLLDMALDSRDEQWFEELVCRRNKM